MYGLNKYMIDINIETLAGTTFSLKVSPLESIQSVKAKIQRHEGIPISHQHLIYQSNELEDKNSLNDYNIPNGATLRMVLTLRGGPINTRRLTTEDTLLRDVSDLMEIHEDSNLWTSNQDQTGSSSNKHVTLLLLRDGDHFNLLKVIERGDAPSPISGAMSAASMYVPYENEINSTEKNSDDAKILKKINSSKINLINKRKKSAQNENLKTKEKMMEIKAKLEKIKMEKLNSKQKETEAVKKEVSEEEEEEEEFYEEEDESVDDDDEEDEEYLEDDDEYDDDEEDEDEVYDEEYDDEDYRDLSQSVNNLETEYDNEEEDDENYDEEEHELLLNKSEFLLNEDQAAQAQSPQNQDLMAVLMLNTNSDQYSVNRVPSSLATTALPTLLTPSYTTDNENFLLSNSNSARKKNLSSKIEYVKNRKKVDSKVNQDLDENKEVLIVNNNPDQVKNRKHKKRKSKLDENNNNNSNNEEKKIDKLTKRSGKTKKYHLQEIASFSPNSILVKTISMENLNQKPSRKKLSKKATKPSEERPEEIPEPIKRISSSQKKVSFIQDLKKEDDKVEKVEKEIEKEADILNQNTKLKPIIKSKSPVALNKQEENIKPKIQQKPPPKLEALYSSHQDQIQNLYKQSSIETTNIPNGEANLALKKSLNLNPLLTKRNPPLIVPATPLINTTNRQTATATTTSILKPYQNSIEITRVYSASNKLNRPYSISTNDISTNQKSLKLPPVNQNSNQDILIAGSSNNLNSIGLVSDNSTKKYCFYCKKKTGLASSYICRCGNNYCTQHRNAEAHNCTFDYKTEGRKLIEHSNPLVAAPKLPKI